MARHRPIVSAWVHEMLDHLRNGGIGLAPTSTGWGWITDPTKVDEQRWRSTVSPLDGEEPVLLVANDSMVNRLCPDLPEQGWDLLDLTVKPLNLITAMKNNGWERLAHPPVRQPCGGKK